MTMSASAELTVRVAVHNGAPRILVNGKPVRARMFFGGPGSSPISVGPEGKRIEFEFVASSSAPGDGTMHFRFGQRAGDIWIDNVEVRDGESGAVVLPRATFESGRTSLDKDWVVWPFGERNTVGAVEVSADGGEGNSAAMHVRLREPVSGPWPDFHIYRIPNLQIERGRTYKVSLWCRADPPRMLSVNFYRPGPTFIHLGGPPSRYESQIRLAADADVHFVSFIVPTPWPRPGEAEDWTAVDAECDRVLKANPRALLLPRFGLDPPSWWAQEYPEAMMVWENGVRRHTAVPASPRYRTDAAARAAALVAHLESRYGDHMAGYHPCGQNTGEWFYEETWGSLLNGYAPADQAGFRDWLRRRYRSDANLQAAWKDPEARLADVVVPPPAVRRAAPNGVLRDPASERMLVDFAEYQQHAMADLVCEIARAVRQASRGRKLVVFFYGYAYEFGGVHLGPATSGHYAMRRVLECPDIDVLCSPISYGDRGFAQTGPVMSAAESVPLTGTKMWLQEDDTRTHESPDTPDAIARCANLYETTQVLTRNIANEATRNMATWWMDLGMEGWFDDPELWALLRRLEPLDRVFLQQPIPYRPEVASVMDERSMLLVAPGAYDVTFPIIYGARHQLGRMGAPYGQYLLDDVVAGRVRARMYVFHNAWWLDAQTRRQILNRTAGALRMWCYAPGACESSGISLQAMRELTGFECAQVSPEQAIATPTETGRRLGLTTAFGTPRRVAPLFAVKDALPEETLATYPDGSVAVALRTRVDGWSLFVGAPGMTPDLLRVAARTAGVHLYTEHNAGVWSSGPVLAIEALETGPLTVHLRKPANVRDLLTGRVLSSGKELTLPLQRGEVRLLRVR